MAEGSGGLGHIVTPADRLTRIAHDAQHVCQRQLAGCGCFLSHLFICTAGRTLGAPSARTFSTVSVHRAIARATENRAVKFMMRFICTTMRYSKPSARAVRFGYREGANPTHGCGKASDVIPKQWAEKEAGKTIENLTQPELVPNQASKSTIVRGGLMNDTTTQRKICPLL